MPNIKSLARRQDVEGLVEATSYQDVKRDSSGTTTDSGVHVRADAILALGALDRESGGEAVAAALRDPADRVRCAAVRVLHAREESTVLARALGWLPTDKGSSRTFAIQALVDLRTLVNPWTVVDALLHREDEELLGEADAQLIVALLEDERVEARDATIHGLILALGAERGIVADRAAELLVRLAPASVEALVAELHAGSLAADAAYVLGRIRDPEAADALVEALWHADPRVRAESAAALGELQDPDAVRPLLQATRDPDHGVRVQAAGALDRIGNVAVIVGVAAMLEPTIDGALRSRQRRPRTEQSNGGPPDSATPSPARDQKDR